MKKLRQFDALVIEDHVKEQFHQPSHGQNYYEIVYILQGRGQHHLNNAIVDYKAHDWFLISPEDTHYLEIRRKTHFAVIKFTDGYFSGRKYPMPDIMIFKELKLKMDSVSQRNFLRIIRSLVDARERTDLPTSPFIFYQLLALFALMQEQWADTNIALKGPQHSLITYIHQHIYDPEKIQAKHLSATFNISPLYFGKYFKKNYGIAFREYIDNYKLKLIESRVLAGLTLRQIADEFGFTDESHLSHYFKKKNTLTLREYRKKKL